ncbi:uncharacterized protein (DUF924 family) [Fluviicoccus keumensis]|uniref:Uncharacterized protein (DUF924 family) n=1 Tax=Fluviicoccus keumensis TaxID=1435465 RepID=A0A4Q7Z5Y9_9GAMM|nr:DUF924 family protein [Fluviicoccus keumensis]RZU45133.1 uncharacterized protein (DUF924 family) [Fluviicoccus keumensis]
MTASYEGILDFWFGPQGDDTVVANRQAGLWWSKDPALDAEIRDRFESLVYAAADGDLTDWHQDARGRLALIILVDQFSRNIWRDTPQSFVFDTLARQWCKDGLASRQDRLLKPIERVFFYLPLEHSEDRDDQTRSVALFRELASSVPAEAMKTFAFFLTYATRHQDIIERFGRFPHRNRILGRESTPEETAFLQEPGSSF